MAGALGGGSVVVDNNNITDREVRNSIEKAVVEGKVPQVDISKVSLDRVAQAYVEVAKRNNVDLVSNEEKVDLYEKIRDKKAGRGEKLQPKNHDVLIVQ